MDMWVVHWVCQILANSMYVSNIWTCCKIQKNCWFTYVKLSDASATKAKSAKRFLNFIARIWLNADWTCSTDSQWGVMMVMDKVLGGSIKFRFLECVNGNEGWDVTSNGNDLTNYKNAKVNILLHVFFFFSFCLHRHKNEQWVQKQ